MEISYIVQNTFPNDKLMEGISGLYSKIFNTNPDNLLAKMKSKTKLLFVLALHEDRVVGFKIGYEINTNTFYSWLGGVDPAYRNNGIASKLMEQQHDYLRKQGYRIVLTKTMNKWRNMLLLNIKSGFDIIDTYTDDKGLHKIILEKDLSYQNKRVQTTK